MKSSLKGWLHGFAGVVIFSGSLPATRAAVADFDPVFLTLARAAIAGAIGGLLLLLSRQRLPERCDRVPLVIVAAGVVIGWPLLSALALRRMTAASAILFVGLLPLSTALFAVWRGRERPGAWFWVFAALGGVIVGAYAGSPASLSDPFGDLLMVVATLLCGLGYAEGAVLSRRLGGWQVICWALIVALPFMLVALCFAPRPSWHAIAASAWIGFGYVTLFSMLIGFFFWYRGLALGGTAAIGQLQLIQPIFALGLAASVLHEQVGGGLFLILLVVIACVVGARRFSVRSVHA
jgi:drug/metabolite transporter (DMT)-like permease